MHSCLRLLKFGFSSRKESFLILIKISMKAIEQNEPITPKMKMNVSFEISCSYILVRHLFNKFPLKCSPDKNISQQIEKITEYNYHKQTYKNNVCSSTRSCYI